MFRLGGHVPSSSKMSSSPCTSLTSSSSKGYNSLKDYFPTMEMRPNPQCSNSACLERQKEHLQTKPARDALMKAKMEAEALLAKESPVHVDNEWNIRNRNAIQNPTQEESQSSSSNYMVPLPSGSSLTLEVIAGPSHGLHRSRLSTNTSILPLILGRVSPSDLMLKDSEVSGKHAIIDWNINSSKWVLVDVGSLNGTSLNSQAIHHPDSGSRHCSKLVELANGDIITLGSSSKISVKIMQHIENRMPFGVGVASDPMAIHRGGKQLPMEDMCYCQWPLTGFEQFGLFYIFDGHGGAGAAKDASKMLPQNVCNILSDPRNQERVLSHHCASDVLREAFSLTEAAMNHQYEGCTATVLLVWFDNSEGVFAQCANVGDSACVINISGKQITMTEDHRVVSLPEQTRLTKMGKPLRDGEARLCGLNIGRMLGDKFLKEQDERFIAEPYISQVVHITKACTGFALLASDGLWDVISVKKAVQLVLQTRERYDAHDNNSAERIANYVLSEARTLRTKDNTSIIFLDFDAMRTSPCIINS